MMQIGATALCRENPMSKSIYYSKGSSCWKYSCSRQAIAEGRSCSSRESICWGEKIYKLVTARNQQNHNTYVKHIIDKIA